MTRIEHEELVAESSAKTVWGATLMLLATIAAILFAMSPTIKGDALAVILMFTAAAFAISAGLFLWGCKEQRELFDLSAYKG